MNQTGVIPSFDWSGGHSGRLLNEDAAKAIEVLWADYLSNHTDNIDGVNMNAINRDSRKLVQTNLTIWLPVS